MTGSNINRHNKVIESIHRLEKPAHITHKVHSMEVNKVIIIKRNSVTNTKNL